MSRYNAISPDFPDSNYTGLMIRKPLTLLLLPFLLPGSLQALASDSPLVAVASGMQFAMREIADSFHQDTGIALRITLGASGKLFRQIENNAPFELFIAADDSLVQKLEQMQRVRAPGVVIARGRLAVFAAQGSPWQADAELRGLTSALDANQVTKFAIANPVHAPYGQRAREALQAAGLWTQVKDRLVIGENVAQAAQFAISGAAQGGIIAHSMLMSDKTSNRGEYALLPESWHQPILHSMVLLENSDETTMKFFHYLQSAKAQQILSRYGFTPAL
ncbi:MAG: molybdate ABC transporter substrate-binding protein [Gammaproteobacteria bacterium]|nr:molybdate ABC transporter substrate-binding protein [Gammaproteobacteria bacterium]